jgi:hypothetical protein
LAENYKTAEKTSRLLDQVSYIKQKIPPKTRFILGKSPEKAINPSLSQTNEPFPKPGWLGNTPILKITKN